MLESSDIDGGSSVAVLTYLWRILDSVEHPDLIHLILQYLLALDDPLTSHPMTPRSPAAEKRRESLLSLSQEDGGEDQLNPSFFNLTDLILASVKSLNAETLTAALRLITVLLMKHHSHSYSSLLRVSSFKSPGMDRSFGAVQKELSVYYDLACAFGGSTGLDVAYDNCLKDALAMVESHTCSSSKRGMHGMSLPISGRHRSAILEDDSLAIQNHRLLLDDPLLNSLMDLLRNFFTNDVETNLGLTNVITYLAACPFTGLEGWLVVDPNRYAFNLSTVPPLAETENDDELEEAAPTESDPEKEEDARVGAFNAACRTPQWAEQDDPAVVHVLKYLLEQYRLVKESTPNLDHLIASRKRAFQGATEIDEDPRTLFPPGVNSRMSTPASVSRASSRNRGPRQDLPLRGTTTPNGTSTLNRGRVIGSAQQRDRVQSPAGSVRSGRSIQVPVPETPGSTSGREFSTSPSKISRALSPLKAVMTATDSPLPSITAGSQEARAAEALILDRRLQFPMGDASGKIQSQELADTTSEGKDPSHVSTSKPADEEQTQEDTNEEDGTHEDESEEARITREASLSHVLTNVVLLQEFILELVALVQVRSSLIEGEIKFQ